MTQPAGAVPRSAGVAASAAPLQAAASAPRSTLTAPATLTAGQSLQSANGNFRLVMQGDGNVVLYDFWNHAMYQSKTSGHSGAHLSLQRDGNLVLYGRSGRAVKSWRTHGARLVVQNDGNVVLYASNGRPTWQTRTARTLGSAQNPTPAAVLRRGTALTAGKQLAAYGGAHAILQKDGNFVVYRAGNGVAWASNSSGWQGDVLRMQSDGNLVLYAAGGAALWSAGTGGGRGWVAVMTRNGDFAVYNKAGAIIWQSATAPRPRLFPPATSAPPIAVSNYLRALTGATSDVTLMRNMGCSDGQHNKAGHRYLVVLHAGAQATNIAGTWGVIESGSQREITDAGLVTAVKAFIDGYTNCMPSYSQTTIAVATNNDSHQYALANDGCRRPPQGKADPLSAAGGTNWATKVIRPLAAYAATKSQVGVGGGNDIEPGFEGCPDQATAWEKAYAGATTAPFVFIGSADGCPYSAPKQSGTCNWGWTQGLLYSLAYGITAKHSVPMPQIYNNNMAQQWANISYAGVKAGQRPIQFGGVLTEVAACQQAKSCTSLNGTNAWKVLWARLKAIPSVAISGMPYATDLRIN